MFVRTRLDVIALCISLSLFVATWGYIGYNHGVISKALKDADELLNPFSTFVQKIKPANPSFPDDTVNILLLGIDRRERYESVYRTDIMILISVNTSTKKVALISVPRDLWYDGGRINAVYIFSGFERLADGFEEITGLRPQKFILTDFADFTWMVDAMGGVPIKVETTFTDYTYPIDATEGIQTVSFTQGPELLTGDRALIFSRSRKGDYDSGDWGRMKRQHLILKGMLDAVVQPKSIFNPMVVEKAFKTVTTGKIDTNLDISDAKFLWNFYKDKDEYEIKSFYLGYDHLYTPPAADYGGAWVLDQLPGGFEQFKNEVNAFIYNIPVIESPAESQSTL